MEKMFYSEDILIHCLERVLKKKNLLRNTNLRKVHFSRTINVQPNFGCLTIPP